MQHTRNGKRRSGERKRRNDECGGGRKGQKETGRNQFERKKRQVSFVSVNK